MAPPKVVYSRINLSAPCSLAGRTRLASWPLRACPSPGRSYTARQSPAQPVGAGCGRHCVGCVVREQMAAPGRRVCTAQGSPVGRWKRNGPFKPPTYPPTRRAHTQPPQNNPPSLSEREVSVGRLSRADAKRSAQIKLRTLAYHTHRVSREEGLLVDHLRKDAANAPEVHWSGVVLDAQQDFGGAVPQRDDLAEGGRKVAVPS